MSEELLGTLKNHGKCILKILQLYFLAVALGWAAYPLFLAILARYMTLDVPMAIYSVFASVVFAIMLIAEGNDFGLTDRKPYKWARYKGKGFVIGACVGIMMFLLEILTIIIANSVFKVSHPQFDIQNINNYLRMLFVSPFFWFFELVGKGETVFPRVTWYLAAFCIPFVSLFTGTGYLLGLKGIEIKIKRRNRDGN